MDGHLDRRTNLRQLDFVQRMVSIDEALIRWWSPRSVFNRLTLPPRPAREGIMTVVRPYPKCTPEISGIEFDWAMAKALVQFYSH